MDGDNATVQQLHHHHHHQQQHQPSFVQPLLLVVDSAYRSGNESEENDSGSSPLQQHRHHHHSDQSAKNNIDDGERQRWDEEQHYRHLQLAFPTTSFADAAADAVSATATNAFNRNGTMSIALAEVAAMSHQLFPSSSTITTAAIVPNCVHVSDAIRAQGIDDLTSQPYVQLMFGFVYGALFALGLSGNGGVLWAVTRNKRLRSARNIFLLNLILTDLLLCLTGVPVTPWYALSKEWRFGSLMCRLMPLSNSCAVFVTSWSLTAIALDKFMHIIDPTREPFSVRLAGFVTVLIWLICSLVNIPYLLSYELVDGSYYVPKNSTPFCGRFCDEINWQGETQRRLYGSTVMLFQFVVPMAIITYCYWRILDKVHKDMIIQNTQFSQSLTNSQRLHAVNRKKRVNYILIGMVLAFIGCWLPMTAVNLAKDFKQEPVFIRQQPYFWPLVAHAIAMSTVIWNPLLFFWLTRKQKRGKLGGVLHTSEIITSLASRMHSLRSTSGGSANEARFKRRHQQSFDSATLVSNINSSRNNSSNQNNHNHYNNGCTDPLLPNRPLLSKNGSARSSASSCSGGRRLSNSGGAADGSGGNGTLHRRVLSPCESGNSSGCHRQRNGAGTGTAVNGTVPSDESGHNNNHIQHSTAVGGQQQHTIVQKAVSLSSPSPML